MLNVKDYILYTLSIYLFHVLLSLSISCSFHSSSQWCPITLLLGDNDNWIQKDTRYSWSKSFDANKSKEKLNQKAILSTANHQKLLIIINNHEHFKHQYH